MITPSLIYAGVTVLLGLVDAIRIKAIWGKSRNIDHGASTALGIMTALTVCFITMWGNISNFWWALLWFVLLSAMFVVIRLAIFDPFLNLFRILTKTNPTMRLDYESATTNSYVDNHSHPIGFWGKRALALAAWFILCILSRLIFKS